METGAIDLRERFDTHVRRHLAATQCDTDDASASLECLSRQTLLVKQHRPQRKRFVSDRTRQLYEQRRRDFDNLGEDGRREVSRAIRVSCRQDCRDYVDGVLNDMQVAELAAVATAAKCLG